MKVFAIWKDRNVILWFVTTVLPALLPIMASGAAAIIRGPWPTDIEEYVRMIDVIFVGITINLANINMWRTNLTDEDKIELIGVSLVLFVLLTVFFVGVSNGPSMPLPTNLIIVILVVISICLNFHYNKRLWKKT
jgi:hypothetical protein